MRGYDGLVLRWPGRERFLLMRIHGGKRRFAVLSLFKRRSGELLAVILSYENAGFRRQTSLLLLFFCNNRLPAAGTVGTQVEVPRGLG
jgi:hypothetical protein